ncbi:MAG TPA: glycosyltransferase [Bryobacteraceae bacterium]
MRILLTNSSLAKRAGSELYVLDIARELLRRGHQPVCYSPNLGEIADDLIASTIAVTDRLSNIQIAPDVIHGQHHMETLTALLHFPGVPAIQYCHGWLPWEEAPIHFPRLRHYVVVSELGHERLVMRHGIPSDRVTCLPNFFDENRFPARTVPLPAKPDRALLLSNAFDAEAAPVREACRRFGIALDVVGLAAGSVHSKPEVLLPNYPIVFSLGRGAIEAMACGAAVICLAEEGTGPLVTPANFDALRAINFGIRAVNGPLTADVIARQIELYDPTQASAISARIRSEATLGSTASRLIDLYTKAIEANQGPPQPEDESRAVAAYLSEWSPRFKDWAHRSGQADRALQSHAERLEHMLVDVRTQLEDARTQAKDALAQAADDRAQADEIRNSLAWRMSKTLLSIGPLRFVAGLLKGQSTPARIKTPG